MELTKNELPRKYKKEFPHTYTLGPFPTFELLYTRPEQARAVYIDEAFNEREKLERLCRETGIPFFYSKRALERIADKEACYAAAAFDKYACTLDNTAPHIVLVHPGDMGNLGTILRTVLGFGIKNAAVIEPAADLFNPKTIRASMGALFKMNAARFGGFEQYRSAYSGGRDLFPFMLDGGTTLTIDTCPRSKTYSLIFGNESSGLPPEFQQCGMPLFIPQTRDVDSLNVSVAAGIGTFLFTQRNPTTF